LAILSSLYAIVLVALGLGFVIFIHELGHFLLAKWNDVKVEKFSIGFGPTIFGFRRGETEYVLAAVPLGGFVKMLGEGPEDEQNKSTDPRAYGNKAVGARMAIISAGVIMNIFLGLACFVYAYGHGMIEAPAKVGAVVPDSPAYKAGLRPGDEIVSIDGRRDISYLTLVLKVSLSGTGQVLRFGVQRPGHDGLIEKDLQPVREDRNDHPTIGIGQAEGLMVDSFRPPAGMVNPPSEPRLEPGAATDFNDTLLAAGPVGQTPKPIATPDDYHRLLAREPNQPIKHLIERRKASAGEDGPVLEQFELTLPPADVVDFGLRLTAEPISAVQAGSIAEAAGFRAGDRILKVGDSDNFDPMRLPGICYQNAAKPMTFEVERAAADGGRKTLTITVTPDDTPPWGAPWLSRELRHVDIPGLGLCFPITPRVVAVKPDSPAARASIKPGDVINSMTVKSSKPANGSDGKPASSTPPATFTFDDGSAGWVGAFWRLQLQPDLDVDLVVNKASQPVSLRPEREEGWGQPSRGLMFLLLRSKLPPQPIFSALRRGFDDTVENILNIYAMLRSLATRRVSPSSMGGVITISRVAFDAARTGVTYLIHFLGMLSINLAVLNFLPIPPLDGGQMVFLVAEKVRGRPLPEAAVAAGTYLGLFLVLGLMIFVTFQDIFRLF
jgi:regulator of sigma E protease